MQLELERQVLAVPDYSQYLQDLTNIFSKYIPEKFQNTSISVSIVSEAKIQELHRQHKGKDTVTDVLSFPFWDELNLSQIPDLLLGEIIICYSRLCLQAEHLKHSLEYELAVLYVHGLCHLIGYDHILEEDYQKMRLLEQKVLQDILSSIPIFKDM